MKNCYKPGSNNFALKLVLIFVYLIFSTPAYAEREVTIYVADNFPPYSFETGQVPQGIYVSIINEIFSRIEGYRPKIEAVPTIRAKEYLRTGRGFAMVPAHKSHNDRNIYSDALLTERIITVCTDDVFDENNRQKWPEDYQGLVVGFRRGDDTNFLGTGAQPLAKGVRVTPTDNIVSNMKKLLSGRIDCYITESLSFLFELQVLSKEGFYNRNLAPPFTKGADVMVREAHFMFGEDTEEDQELSKRISEIVSEMRTSGLIDDIIASYLRE